MLSKDCDPFLGWWELDLTTREAKTKYQNRIDRDKLKTVESLVSEYIRQSFTFTVFSVADKQDRLRLESRMISSVSLCGECHPSSRWLGLFSPKDKIKQSGLWQVNELYKEPLSTSDKEELNSFYLRRL